MTEQTAITKTAIIYVDATRQPEYQITPISNTSVSIMIIADTMEEAQSMYNEALTWADEVAERYTAPEQNKKLPVKEIREALLEELEEKPKIQHLMHRIEKARDFCEKNHAKHTFSWNEAEYIFHKYGSEPFKMISVVYDLAFLKGYNKARRYMKLLHDPQTSKTLKDSTTDLNIAEGLLLYANASEELKEQVKEILEDAEDINAC